MNDIHEITVDAVLENIPAVTDWVNDLLEQADCPMKAQLQLDVAIDELFSNIARYAYAPQTGKATLRLTLLQQPAGVALTFIDQGKPYDPLAKVDPDVTLSAEERAIGGLGIFLVKKTMDDMTYARQEDSNVLTITKLF